MLFRPQNLAKFTLTDLWFTSSDTHKEICVVPVDAMTVHHVHRQSSVVNCDAITYLYTIFDLE